MKTFAWIVLLGTLGALVGHLFEEVGVFLFCWERDEYLTGFFAGWAIFGTEWSRRKTMYDWQERSS